MGRQARDNRPHVKPVRKIQLSEGNTKWRLIAVVVFLVIGVSALAYSFSQLFTVEPGWQTIQAGTSDGPNCGEDFVFLYETGADGRSAAAESRELTQRYTEACRKAYQLFHADESFEGMINLREINHHPNEVLVVDQTLYRALEAVQVAGDRRIYLGPVYTRYDDLFSCQDDAQLVDFDPRLSQEVAEEYAAAAVFAGDPGQVSVELLGGNRICLRVSEEYLDYARKNGIDRFLDFGWMKNAFIVDYLADCMIEGGYSYGTISSYDGFCRCLDSRGTTDYALPLPDWLEGRAIQAGTMEYQGPMSLVSLRTFPAAAGDEQRFYQLKNGEIRTLYLDPKDGLCRGAVNSLVCWSPALSCAQLAMGSAPAFVADSLWKDPLRELVRKGARYVWCMDNTFYASGPDVIVTDLYEGYTLETIVDTGKSN